MAAKRGTQGGPPASGRFVRHSYDRTHRSTYSGTDDLFAINPTRRSFFISTGSWLMLIVPATLMNGNLQALFLIGFGWIAAAGVVFVTPIFFWSLAEVLWERFQRHRHPTIDQLNLSLRAINLLRRHGYTTIESVDRIPDSSLFLLSNMDQRTVHNIRRAVNLWKYERWQEQGFPASDLP